MRVRGVTGRIIAVVLLSGLLMVPLLLIPLLQVTAEISLRRTFNVADRLTETLARECAADPSGWSAQHPGSSMYAYHDRTLRSANPAAPALDGDLIARLRAGERMPSTLRWTPPFGGQLLVRTAEPGPCGVLGIAWRPHADVGSRTLTWVVAAQIVLFIGAGLGAHAFVVWPLMRRIAALDRAAGHIGDPGAFEPVDDATGDALGRVAERIAESHARIVVANEALKQEMTALEEVLADVAHDVRTPLAALQLRLEQLVGAGRATEDHDAERRGQLIASLEEVVYLTSLIENLRLANRLRAPADGDGGALEIDLRPVLRRVVNRFTALGGMRGMRVRGSWPDSPVEARCDPAAAEQALTNLTQNAVVYGREGGSVTVLLDRLELGFELAVIDDGPGVPPDALPRLVERRFRGDEARSRGPSGRGLGLAIVAEVCARSGWTLTFERQAPQGLKVVIRGARRASAEPVPLNLSSTSTA